MSALGISLRNYCIKTYLAGSLELTRHVLRERSGARDFRRVVIVAALARNDGISSGARLQFNALRKLGIDVDVDVELLDASPALRNPLFRIPHRAGSAYIFHSGGPQTASLIGSVMPHVAQAYRVAYWAWELPDPPPGWADCDINVSEIWTPSAFSRDSLSKLSRRPIAVVPHHVPSSRARVRRPNQPFTVLAMADSRSSLSRKNPEGALRAFHAAFGTSSEARLVLKLGGRGDAWQALEQAAGDLLGGANIEIVRGRLDPSSMTALYRRSDVLLSLHRAEGFGLPMLEAMSHGIPVIATGWSGNLEFMTQADNHLVPYHLVAVRDASGIYAGSVWAEPEQEEARRFLRRLADSQDYYDRFAASAHRCVRDRVPQFPFPIPELPIRPSMMASA